MGGKGEGQYDEGFRRSILRTADTHRSVKCQGPGLKCQGISQAGAPDELWTTATNPGRRVREL